MKILNLARSLKKRVKEIISYKKPSKWLSSPLYAERFNAKWHKVYEKVPTEHLPPTFYGSCVTDLQRRLDSEFPEMGVLELECAYLYGQQGWVFSKEGYFLPDHSWYSQHVEEIKRIPRYLKIDKYLKGNCLTLASDFAVENYAHFLLDCIARLELLKKAGFRISEIDYFFCPKPPSRTAQLIFDKLGIPNDKCIWADDNWDRIVSTEKLLAPTFPGVRRNYPRWVPAFLKSELLCELPSNKRRLYISRTGCRRNVVNEEAIEFILRKYNFEIYNPAEHENQPFDFAEAAIVVGPHGGGLSNLAFCRQGTKVLELIPSDHIYPYYYTLSNAAVLEYSCMVCQSTHERGQDAWGPSSYDFYVDEKEFDNTLLKITSGI